MATTMTAPKRWMCAVVLSLLSPLMLTGPALAKSETERSRLLLKQAIEFCHIGKLQASLGLLDKARKELIAGERDRRLMGRILLYTGLNLALMRKRARARAVFKEALAEDPGLSVSSSSFKPEMVRLFNEVRDRTTSRLMASIDEPGATVLVDGRQRGMAPLTVRLAAGRHQVQIRTSDGTVVFDRQLVFIAGRTVRAAVRQEPRADPPPARFRIWTLVMAGTSVALTAAGAALWASSDASYAELEDGYQDLMRRKQTAAVEELKEAVQVKERAAVVMFGLAGASAVAAMVLFYLDRRTSEEGPHDGLALGATRFVPTLVRRGAGLTLQARF